MADELVPENKLSESLVSYPDEPIPKDPIKHSRYMKHRRTCEICLHPQAQEIHRDLLSWGTKQEVAEKYGVSPEAIDKHSRKLNITAKRMRRTEIVYEKIIEYGMGSLDRLEIKAKDVIHAAERLDKLSGREVRKLEISGPPTVTFIGIPQPGGIHGKREEKAIEGKVVPTIPSMAPESPETKEAEEDKKESEATGEITAAHRALIAGWKEDRLRGKD